MNVLTTSLPVSARFLRTLAATLFLGSVMLTGTTALAQDKIGTVTTSQGNVSLLRAGNSLPAPTGTEVKATDTLRTGEAANVSVAFADGTRVLLGPNSNLSMEAYAYNPDSKKGNMTFNFAKGTMRMITGAITKNNPDAAVLKTPSATAGIRGTDFIVDVPASQ